MILEEFDPEKRAVLNAENIIPKVPDFPKVVVSCFSQVTFQRLINELNGVRISGTSAANLDIPVYKVTYRGIEIALFTSYVGSAGCTAICEDIFAMGAETIIVFGTCGVLQSSIDDCSIIIPDVAVRDEGTSYHYAPASDEIKVNTKYRKEFIDILERYNCKYTMGKVWTTDGIYRETKQKVERRKAGGCICVDMECSALAAMASFRNKNIFHFFYAADNLYVEEWDMRSLANDAELLKKDRIAMLSMELAVKINN